MTLWLEPSTASLAALACATPATSVALSRPSVRASPSSDREYRVEDLMVETDLDAPIVQLAAGPFTVSAARF